MPDYKKCCGNCIWNEDLLCDKSGKMINDTDRACRSWEGDGNIAGVQGKSKNTE